MTDLEKESETPFENRLQLMARTERFEATESSLQEELNVVPIHAMNNGLEMVLELEDLKTIGALPDTLLQQLGKQTGGDNFLSFSVKSEEELSDGYNESGELRQFQCKICYKYCREQDELDAHELSHCKNRLSFECKYCQKRFYFKSSLYHHEKRHEKRHAAGLPEPHQGNHKCTICNKGFEKSDLLQSHMRRHEAMEKGTYRCKICDYAFGNAMQLKRHELKHETKPEWNMSEIPPPVLIKRNNQTVYKCSKCSRLFKMRVNYCEHAHRHINRRTSKSHHCQHCGKSYGYLSSLQYHLKTVHNNAERTEPLSEPVSLVENEQNFHNEASYGTHMSTPDSISADTTDPPAFEEPPFIIKSEITIEDTQLIEDTTAMNYAEPDVTRTEPLSEPAPAVEIEKRIHHCRECDAFFSTQACYEIHMSTHRPLAGPDSISAATTDPPAHEEPPFTIKSEITIEDIQLHEETAARGSSLIMPSKSAESTEPISSDTVWKCGECGHLIMYNNKTLTYHQSYQEHQKMHYHLENNTFKCDMCKLVFTTNIELKQHSEENHPRDLRNTEECRFCGKLIKNGLTFRLHIKAHENINLKKHM